MKALPGSNAMLEANEFGLYVNIIINWIKAYTYSLDFKFDH
jgi:hypothetical protein